MWWWYKESERGNKGEDDRLIATAKTLIEAAYKEGKYEGRHLRGFFSTLFDRIDMKLTARLAAEV